MMAQWWPDAADHSVMNSVDSAPDAACTVICPVHTQKRHWQRHLEEHVLAGWAQVIRWGPAEPPVGTPFIDVLENYLLMFKADTNYTGWVSQQGVGWVLPWAAGS
jgi:hypothetical protein